MEKRSDFLLLGEEKAIKIKGKKPSSLNDTKHREESIRKGVNGVSMGMQADKVCKRLSKCQLC